MTDGQTDGRLFSFIYIDATPPSKGVTHFLNLNLQSKSESTVKVTEFVSSQLSVEFSTQNQNWSIKRLLITGQGKVSASQDFDHGYISTYGTRQNKVYVA